MASLYLLPSLLAENTAQKVVPQYNIDKVKECEYFIVEQIRTARRFLRTIGYKKDFDKVVFFVLDEHTLDKDISQMLLPIYENKDIFLLSEAGLPCIADPGAKVVSLAQSKNIKIIPLVGASSIYLSLMASGFNGQNFAFVGYLPIKENERAKAIKTLEQKVYKDNQTQIFIETPYRNKNMLQALCSILKNDTMLCIAKEVSSLEEQIIARPISWWKNNLDFCDKKFNAIFLIYK